MKLWEVIKALTGDPTKVFERKDRYKKWTMKTDVAGGAISGETYYFMLDCDGEDSYGDAGKFNGNLAGNEDDWQLVRQPVTWQEAIQAWADGKEVCVENKAGGRVYRHGGEGKEMHLLQSEITTGTWYAED